VLKSWADNPEEFPRLVPLIWQTDVNRSPHFNERMPQMYQPPVGGYISFPHTQYGGNIAQKGGNPVPAQYHVVAGRNSPLELDFRYFISYDELRISARVSLDSNITTPNNKIIFLLTTDFPNQQGGNYFNSVVGYEEQDFTLTQVGDWGEYIQVMNLEPSWNIELMHIAVLVQSLSPDYIIHQAEITDLSTPSVYPAVVVEPANQAVNVPLNQVLQWVAGDETVSSYSLYFGTTNPPTNFYYLGANNYWSASEWLEPGTTYYWQVISYSDFAESVEEPIWSFTTTNEVGNLDSPISSISTKLNGNYPNPFNPNTTITFTLQNDSQVLLNIYNVKGQVVKTLINDYRRAGAYQINWNGRDDAGLSLSSGVYFYRFRAGEYDQTKQMLFLK